MTLEEELDSKLRLEISTGGRVSRIQKFESSINRRYNSIKKKLHGIMPLAYSLSIVINGISLYQYYFCKALRGKF